MKFRFSILFIFFNALLCSQGGFKRQFNLPGTITNSAKGIYQKQNGDYIAGGIIVDTILGHVSSRIAIVGLDTNGYLQWVKKYGNYKFEYFAGMGNPWFYFDGNFLFHTGVVKDSLNKLYGVLMKFDLNGDTVWQKTYKDTLYNVTPQMVTKSVDGGLLLTGTWFNPGGDDPALLIKTDSNGNELWRKEIHKGGVNYQECKAILQDSASKKIVVVGFQLIVPGIPSDNILILDSLGNKLAQHNFAGPDGGALADLIQTKDGKFVAVGQKRFPQQVGGTNLTKAFAVKFDVNTPNPPIWRFSYDKLVPFNVFTFITELENEDMIIAGTIDTMQLHNMPTNALARITKIDKNGVVKWNNYYNYKSNPSSSNNNMGLWCLNPTSDKGFVAAVEFANSPNPNPFFFVKYDSSGCDSTEEYCQMMAEVSVNELQLQDVYFRIYPNPFKDVIKIDIHLISTSFKDPLVFTITDITGKVLQTSQFNSLQKTLILETKNLSSGLYFLNSIVDGKSYSFKVYKE